MKRFTEQDYQEYLARLSTDPQFQALVQGFLISIQVSSVLGNKADDIYMAMHMAIAANDKCTGDKPPEGATIQ